MTPPDTATQVTVLIVGTEAFEGGYVASVLAARDIRVAGPHATLEEGLEAIDTARPSAAIVSPRTDNLLLGVIEALEERRIPYLTLIGSDAAAVMGDRPFLTRPFAGYQLADWVVAAVPGAGGVSCPV